jgi:PAS domain S-box-containing protein
MTDDFDPKDHTKEELATRIQHLEQELALLQGKVRAQKSPASAQAAPIPPQVNAPESGMNWLLDTIKHLLTEHNSASINYTLEQLGQRLELVDCSLWHWEAHSRKLDLIGSWQADNLPQLQQTEWLDNLLRRDSPEFEALLDGQGLQLNPTHLGALAGDAGIRTTRLIPIQRNHNTEGFIALHAQHPDNLYSAELTQINLIADLLFSVHDRQHLLRTLADRDTRFQYAMEASRDGLWDWNIETGQMYFSRSYLRMLGYRYDSLPGTLDTVRDYFLHPEDAEQVLTQYRAAIDNQRSYMNLEFRMLHQNGSELWIYSRAKFVEPDENGRARRCVGINADITDFIHSQEELLAAKTQADTANKTKSEFLARMSHEIRTPMNAIIGLGHLLHDTALNEQQQSYLGSMTTAAESLLHIINQVLDFSKIETGKIMLENSHFDLDQIFEKLSRLFEISALHKAADIVYDIKHDVPRFLRGDASRLSQVISHLISNALQYSTSNQVVVGVKAVKQNSHHVTLEFTITDFGVGMNTAQLTQLQNSLLKGPASEAVEQNAANGFGLSICNHLVALMNGRIQLNSKPGKGCKISFTARFEHSHIGAKSLHDQPNALNNLRALIVDDNTIARNIIASTAHSIRLHADTADSGKQAFEKIRAADSSGKPYHLVLMDYKMPQVDGLQAAALIKADTRLKNMPLIFLISSYHRDEIFKGTHTDESLVDGFLNKPVSESRLFDTIHQAIDKNHPLYKLMDHDTDNEDDDRLLANLHVLLAEDNLVNQQVARGILRKKGVEVTIANNGREAVELLQARSDDFDFILMDLEMPELDGYQATQQIRQSNICPGIPIIAVTAQAMRGDRERCLAAGMNDYLTKPIMPDLLYRTLADIMRAQGMDKKA